AGPGHRPDHLAPAAVLAPAPRDRGRDPAVLRPPEHRRDRLLADGLRAVDGRDDERADRGPAPRRLAEAPPRLPGAAATSQPDVGEAAADPWQTPWLYARRSGSRLGAEQPGRH